jgi:hypothetical protein
MSVGNRRDTGPIHDLGFHENFGVLGAAIVEVINDYVWNSFTE